jgi:hypothetical protein
MTIKNWVTDLRTRQHHRDGIPWHQAPRPRRYHLCRPWTIGIGNYGPVFRCACGALQLAGDRKWVGRNCRN